jgi:hypothetical protein
MLRCGFTGSQLPPCLSNLRPGETYVDGGKLTARTAPGVPPPQQIGETAVLAAPATTPIAVVPFTYLMVTGKRSGLNRWSLHPRQAGIEPLEYLMAPLLKVLVGRTGLRRTRSCRQRSVQKFVLVSPVVPYGKQALRDQNTFQHNPAQLKKRLKALSKNQLRIPIPPRCKIENLEVITTN